MTTTTGILADIPYRHPIGAEQPFRGLIPTRNAFATAMELGARVAGEQYAEDIIDIVALLPDRYAGNRFGMEGLNE